MLKSFGFVLLDCRDLAYVDEEMLGSVLSPSKFVSMAMMEGGILCRREGRGGEGCRYRSFI